MSKFALVRTLLMSQRLFAIALNPGGDSGERERGGAGEHDGRGAIL
jgi:hypothetical protein